MNIRNHPSWSVRHEARLQTLFAAESLLNLLRSTAPDQVAASEPFDLLSSKQSAEEVLEELMKVVPTEGALLTANAMLEAH